jgi:hypothetical protein
MSFVDWFKASFLYCLSLSPLRVKKSGNYHYRDSWKSDNFRKEAIKKEAKN